MGETQATAAKIVLLHHSTGKNVWDGGVPEAIAAYNQEKGTSYSITEQAFPKAEPYGWNNYPYDYWNLWVSNAGPEPYMEEPTLEILTQQYDVIVFKHCFPVAGVAPDEETSDVTHSKRTLGNYKLQYEALKKKLREFPKTKFIVWTGAMLCESATKEEVAKRAVEFFDWVKNEWDEPGDNIFVWDFGQLETGGGLYLKEEFQKGPNDAHPSPEFCKRVAPLLAKRITDVIEGRGDDGSLTGE